MTTRLIPEHTLELYVRMLLRRTPYTFKDAAPFLDMDLSLRENLKSICRGLQLTEETPIEKVTLSTLTDTSLVCIEKDTSMRTLKVLEYPHVREQRYEDGITPLKMTRLRWDDCVLLGIDTETAYNDAETFPSAQIHAISAQIYGENFSKFIRDPEIDGRWLERFRHDTPELFDRKKPRIVFFAHNLWFDLNTLFGAKRCLAMLEGNDSQFKTAIQGAMSFVMGRVGSFDVFFIDTSNFFSGSLKKISRSQFPDEPKLTPPAWLGQRTPQDEKEWTELEVYAMHDAKLHYKLGCLIRDMQVERGLGVTMTPASMSAKIYRRDFLKDPIYYPPEEIARFIYEAKYGAVCMALARGFSPLRCYNYDFKGLYTDTMLRVALPFSCSRRRGYRTLTRKEVLFADDDKIVGWARVRFKFPEGAEHPCLTIRADKNYYPLEGEGTYTTYEIRYAVERGAEIKVFEAIGWDLEPMDRDHSLAKYVRTLTQEKDEIDRLLKDAKGEEKSRLKLRRTFVKLLGNSIYGKFAEINEDRAGVLFHPAFCSLILGYSKIKTFRAMDAIVDKGGVVLYTDTDSLLTTLELEKSPLSSMIGEVTGQLTNETPEGVYPFIVKSKMYILFDPASMRAIKSGHHAVHFKNPEIKCEDCEVILEPSDKFFCPLCARDCTPEPEDLERRDPRLLDGGRLAELLKTASGSVIQYVSRHFVKTREAGRRKDIQVNRVTYPDMSLDARDDGKRVYDKHVDTFEGLRDTLIFSRPPQRIKLFPLAYEELDPDMRKVFYSLDYSFEPKRILLYARSQGSLSDYSKEKDRIKGLTERALIRRDEDFVASDHFDVEAILTDDIDMREALKREQEP